MKRKPRVCNGITVPKRPKANPWEAAVDRVRAQWRFLPPVGAGGVSDADLRDLSPELRARVMTLRKGQTFGPTEAVIRLLADIEAERAAKGATHGQ